MTRHLVGLGKLLFVAGLMYWVFSSIQWRDSIIRTAPTTGQSEQTFGDIRGRWDGTDIVEFDPEGPAPPIRLRVTDDLGVVPGLTTYWRELDLGWFLLGAACYLLSVVFSATRWWWLLRVNDLPIGFWAAQRYTWIGLFFNNVVPGQTGGDLVKALYVMKRCQGERVPAMMSVVVDRVMGLASLSLLAAVAVLFYLDQQEFASLAVALWAVLGAVVVLGCLAFSRRLRAFVRLKDLLERLPHKIGQLLKRIDQAVYFYRDHTMGMTVWLFGGVLNHVSSVFSYALVGLALGVGMPIEHYFVLIPVIIIVSAVPIAPNGWGVGEGLFRWLFGRFGAEHLVHVPLARAQVIMGTRGVALSVLYRVHLTAWSLLGGVLYFFGKDKISRAELAAEAARDEDDSGTWQAGRQEPEIAGESASGIR